VKIKVNFWSGLGGAHHKWASKDPDLQNVLEVLDVARENVEAHEASKKAGVHVGEDDGEREEKPNDRRADHNNEASSNGRQEDDSSSSSDSESDESDNETDNNNNDDNDDANSTQGDGKGWTKGWADTAVEYKKNRKDKHRRHRGIMQWKIPRTARWASHKLSHVDAKISDVFRHHTRDSGVETEV